MDGQMDGRSDPNSGDSAANFANDGLILQIKTTWLHIKKVNKWNQSIQAADKTIRKLWTLRNTLNEFRSSYVFSAHSAWTLIYLSVPYYTFDELFHCIITF